MPNKKQREPKAVHSEARKRAAKRLGEDGDGLINLPPTDAEKKYLRELDKRLGRKPDPDLL